MSEKKWATGQSFIRKEITSYRNGTLPSCPRVQYLDLLCIFIVIQIQPFGRDELSYIVKIAFAKASICANDTNTKFFDDICWLT